MYVGLKGLNQDCLYIGVWGLDHKIWMAEAV
jgi:hypothetical protein